MTPAWPQRLQRILPASLLQQVPRDHTQSNAQFHRRRIVSAVTLVVGAVLLGVSLAVPPGDWVFYLLTTLVALTWIGGALLSGPLHLGRIATRSKLRRPVLVPIVSGLIVAAVFVAGSLIVRQVPVLRAPVNSVLAHARYGSVIPITVITVLNGIAEEVFFRGALFAAIGRRYPVIISTVIYAAATLATANPMLVFAAFLLGLLLGLQRRASGGILAPILTHITWSATMLFALPALIHR